MPNLEELTRLYWVDGLTQRQISELIGVRRVIVAEATKKFKPDQFKSNQVG